MSSNTKNGWRSFEYPETGYVGMNYIPNNLDKLFVIGDDLPPKIWEMVKEIIKKLEEKENGNKM